MKKTVGLILILVLILSIAVTSYAQFNDTTNHWGLEYILPLTSRGIIGGYPDGSFRPDSNITVAEFIKLDTVAVIEKDIGNSASGNWYDTYVDLAKNLQIVRDGEFSPDDFNREITREEMTRIAIRSMQKDELIGNTRFSDDSLINPSMKGHVNMATTMNIIQGYPDGRFMPQGKATRAEASKLIFMVSEYVKFKQAGNTQVDINYQDQIIREEIPIDIPMPEDIRKEVTFIEEAEISYKDAKDFPSRPFNSLGLSGHNGEVLNEDFFVTDGLDKKTVYYASVDDFPIKVGNYVLTGIETNPEADTYIIWDVSSLYLKGYSLFDSNSSMPNVTSGYIDKESQYRFRRLNSLGQDAYDHYVKFYHDMVGLDGIQYSIKANQKFTSTFTIEFADEWDFKLDNAEYITFYDYINDDKTILLIENPFK